MNSSTNTSNSISSMPELSQAELDKLILTPEVKAHYSQENEIKRLIIERETYKRAYEQQQKNINEAANKIANETDTIILQPVEIRKHKYRVGMSRTCTYTVPLRKYFNHQYETLSPKMNFSKMSRFKIVNEIDYY